MERYRYSDAEFKLIENSFPVLEPAIHRSVKFADATAKGQSIVDFAGEDFDGSRAYAEIAQKIYDRFREDGKLP